MKEKFCFACGENVICDVPDGHTKFVDMRTYSNPSAEPGIEFCDGPFTDPMPEFDPNWDLQPEPSPEEQALMNLEAEMTLQSLGV